MRRRKRRAASGDTPASASDRIRAPILTERLIIREATRTDAAALETTMPDDDRSAAPRTPDGALRFGERLHETPVWSGTRAVSEKGTARIIGGVVITPESEGSSDAQRIGWWLEPGAAMHAVELVRGVDEHLRTLGARRVTMQVRADDSVATSAAEEAGFERGRTVSHATTTGQQLEFVQFERER